MQNNRQNYNIVIFFLSLQTGDGTTKDSELNGGKYCPRWMQFWCVTPVPKHLNFDTFSKNLLAVIKLGFVLHSGDDT